MNRYIRTAALLAASFLAVQVSAQNLNPTVEVTRQYRGNLVDVHKPVMKMALPDSVEQFNLKYDYSVFDNPYKGSYEFTPYLLNMNLTPGEDGSRTLYLRAGAGYTLHPTLDVVWSPVRREKFRMSVHAGHRSYIGRYRSVSALARPGHEDLTLGADGGRYSGRDMLSTAGVSGSVDWKKGLFHFDAGYYGISLKDSLMHRGFDAVDIRLGISSKESIRSHFVYALDLGYRYGEDKLRYTAGGRPCVTAHDFDVQASLGKSFRTGHAFLFDLGYEMGLYGGLFDSQLGVARVTPRYLFSNKRWNINAGVQVAYPFATDIPQPVAAVRQDRGQIFYPDIRIDFTAVKSYLDLYLAIDGGPELQSWSRLLEENHRIHPFMNAPVSYGTGAPLMGTSVERVSAILGLEGNIGARFRYDLHGGYRNFASAPMETVMASPDGLSWRPGLTWTGYQLLFAKLDYSWRSQDVKVDGYFMYSHTDLATAAPAVFAPAAFSGYINAEYNWNRRIFAGIDCDFATVRKGGISIPSATAGELQPVRPARIGGWADLGVYLEFNLTRKFSLWLRGGNLLDMTIQRTPLQAESGINFTAGICLNLQ